ncbi:MAG TPA: YdcF family protein [Pyrinomonadaceae bacterium]|nr:YdcF family protein [Pyrinomonadaceae bacterium]
MNRKRIKKVSLVTAAALVLAFAVSAALIVIDGLSDEIGAADVAIVLGSKVEAGGVPSTRLRARLDKALELYRQGLFPEIIVSGGTGDEGFDEAAVMKGYLVREGVPEERIHVDSGGANTYLTAQNSSRMMKERGWQSALVISQYFHISRTKLALRRSGVSTVFSAHADLFEFRDIYSTVREVFGYGAYLLRAYD